MFSIQGVSKVSKSGSTLIHLPPNITLPTSSLRRHTTYLRALRDAVNAMTATTPTPLPDVIAFTSAPTLDHNRIPHPEIYYASSKVRVYDIIRPRGYHG